MSDASPVRSLDEEEKEEDNLVRSSPERVWLRPPNHPSSSSSPNPLFRYVSQAWGREETVAGASGTRLPPCRIKQAVSQGPGDRKPHSDHRRRH